MLFLTHKVLLRAGVLPGLEGEQTSAILAIGRDLLVGFFLFGGPHVDANLIDALEALSATYMFGLVETPLASSVDDWRGERGGRGS
jgi:hypothetical protein